ncbi:AAA family ATPase [Mesorhizobium sp.]|uniref:AAA family ATPase n=1 Tax=Mesorhizobium sp. TaxID=1871066 RepID=UPI0011F6A20F|nr:AAA family ATPase [Mesorhizobium sp.]TJV19668.1 MAG: hypothetical protein E5Y07_00295 [Mesorhizobium sp.]
MNSADDFQLIEARTGNVKVVMPWRRKTPYMNPHVVFSEQPTVPTLDVSEHITAIIGKNGTGKSHLLTSIVQTFVALEELKTGRKTSISNLPLEYLSYRIGEHMCVVRRLPRRKIEMLLDGEATSAEHLPLPKRVVALTTSPFDKFPVPRPIRRSLAPDEVSIYCYLGLRDRYNKAAIENLLFRSLNSLFEAGEDEWLRRTNIGAAFQYLLLKPTLTVVYRLRIPPTVRHAVNRGGDIAPALSKLRSTQRERVIELDKNYLQDLVETALRREEKGLIRTTANFEYGGIVDDTFKELQPLRRIGFLRIQGVEVTQDDGLVSDLKRASSGQLSMISSLLSLASVISNGSLVLIDEPELSLHPEWQVDYVGLLVQTFARFRGCHFVLATHSPMVISELPQRAKIIALDRPNLPSEHEIAGQSADYLLAEVFGAPAPGNLYVRDRIVRAMRLVAAGEAKSATFAKALEDLRKLATELEEDDPARELIDNLEMLAHEAGSEANQ